MEKIELELSLKECEWKTHFYNKRKMPNKSQTIAEIYGLKSLNCPPLVEELI